MREIMPSAEVGMNRRQRILWRILLVVLLGGLIAFFLINHFSPSPRDEIAAEIFIGLLGFYAGAHGIMTGECINTFNILPIVFAGPVKKDKSPGFFAINVALTFAFGFAVLAHVGWRIIHR